MLASLPEASGENDNLDPFLLYLTTTQGSEGVDTFKETMQRHGIDTGEKLMTYAQEMLEKDRAEGEQHARVEIVEGFLRVGVTWDVIEAATGLTEAGFQALKAQLSGSE